MTPDEAVSKLRDALDYRSKAMVCRDQMSGALLVAENEVARSEMMVKEAKKALYELAAVPVSP